MRKVQSQSTSNPCSISQAASVEALNGPQACIDTMVTAFKERHQFVLETANAIQGVQCIAAQGAFYAFLDVREAMKHKGFDQDADFATALLEQQEVAAVPGSGFGAPGYLRISFATSLDHLNQALARLKAFMDT